MSVGFTLMQLIYLSKAGDTSIRISSFRRDVKQNRTRKLVIRCSFNSVSSNCTGDSLAHPMGKYPDLVVVQIEVSIGTTHKVFEGQGIYLIREEWLFPELIKFYNVNNFLSVSFHC